MSDFQDWIFTKEKAVHLFLADHSTFLHVKLQFLNSLCKSKQNKTVKKIYHKICQSVIIISY